MARAARDPLQVQLQVRVRVRVQVSCRLALVRLFAEWFRIAAHYQPAPNLRTAIRQVQPRTCAVPRDGVALRALPTNTPSPEFPAVVVALPAPAQRLPARCPSHRATQG